MDFCKTQIPLNDLFERETKSAGQKPKIRCPTIDRPKALEMAGDASVSNAALTQGYLIYQDMF
jgi:hypothetical protein